MKDPKERNILIIYTGGTIGMVPTSDIGGLKNASLEELQQRIPETDDLPYNITWEEFKLGDEFIDSSNANPAFYNELSSRLAKRHDENDGLYDKYDGIVVLFGTDTMCPSAGMMSYQLEGVRKPIIFTGSMLPAVDEDTDGKENLLDAVEFAAQSGNEIPKIKEVGISFHGRLMRATHTVKYKADDKDAFHYVTELGEQLSEDPIATIDNGIIEVNKEKLLDPLFEKELQQHEIREDLNIYPVRVCGAFGKITENTFKGSDAILLHDVPTEEPMTEESALTKKIKEFAPDIPIFFAGENPPNSDWIKLAGILDFQQEMVKVHYIMSRAETREEMKVLAEGNLRGESEGEITREKDAMDWARIQESINGIKKK